MCCRHYYSNDRWKRPWNSAWTLCELVVWRTRGFQVVFSIRFPAMNVHISVSLQISSFIDGTLGYESLRSVKGRTAVVDCVWNVMAHARKPDFVFRRNGRVHLNRQARQFSRLLQPVVMLDTPSSEVVWRVLAAHSIRQFPLHFPSRASPCAITFQLDSSSLPLCYCLLIKTPHLWMRPNYRNWT